MNAAPCCELTVRQKAAGQQTLRKLASSAVMFCALCVIELVALPMVLLGSLMAAVWWCADRLIRRLEAP